MLYQNILLSTKYAKWSTVFFCKQAYVYSLISNQTKFFWYREEQKIKF